MTRKCKTCGATFDSLKLLNQHKYEAHGWVKPQSKRKLGTPAAEILRTIDKQLKDALTELEHERNVCHNKIIELDNQIVSVKKRIGTNGH